MSRGGYTSAIDMWSMGCIFGELLQRIVHIGSAATPNLQIAPLFAMHHAPKTPASGCAPKPCVLIHKPWTAHLVPSQLGVTFVCRPRACVCHSLH